MFASIGKKQDLETPTHADSSVIFLFSGSSIYGILNLPLASLEISSVLFTIKYNHFIPK